MNAKRDCPSSASLEAVEPRLLMSADPGWARLYDSGTLRIVGTAGDDRISVELGRSSVDGRRFVLRLYLNDEPRAADPAKVGRIVVQAGAGIDVVSVLAAHAPVDDVEYTSNPTNWANAAPIPVTLFGGAGDDVLAGGGAVDAIFGQAGRDTLIGEEGADLLVGGPGCDIAYATRGDDVVGVESTRAPAVKLFSPRGVISVFGDSSDEGHLRSGWQRITRDGDRVWVRRGEWTVHFDRKAIGTQTPATVEGLRPLFDTLAERVEVKRVSLLSHGAVVAASVRVPWGLDPADVPALLGALRGVRLVEPS